VLVAILVPLAVSPVNTDAAVPKETLFRMLAALAFAGFAGESLALGRLPRLPRGLDLAALGVWVACVCVSLGRTGLHPLALDATAHALAGAALFAAAADPDRGARVGRTAAVCWLAAAAIAAAYGIAQALGIDWLRWSGDSSAAYRVRSTFGHHAFAAAFFAASLPIAVASLRAGAGRGERALGVVAGALSLVALVLSRGRAAILGAFVALGTFAWTARSRGARLASIASVATLALLAATLLAVPSLRARLADGFDPESPTTQVRLAIWRDSLRAASAHPLAGAGIGLYDAAVSEVASDETLRLAPPARFSIGHAHQELLEVLVETGALGLAAFVAFVALAAARTLGPRAKPDVFAAAFAASALAILATNFFDVNLRGASGAAPFFLALGLARSRS
jgi:O-antigen ligase